MQELWNIKKETLENQETIADLEQQLDKKKIESSHRNARLTYTFTVIVWLVFLLVVQICMGLTNAPGAVVAPPKGGLTITPSPPYKKNESEIIPKKPDGKIAEGSKGNVKTKNEPKIEQKKAVEPAQTRQTS